MILSSRFINTNFSLNVSADMDLLRTCPNCNGEFRGRYCSVCGQDQNQSFSTLREMLRAAFHELTELDGRLAKSLAILVFRPGRMTVDYLAHKRARFIPPFRLYLMASVVLYFTLGMLTEQASIGIDLIDDPIPALSGSEDQAESGLIEWLDERLDVVADEPALGSSVFGHVPEVSFVLLPFAAMLLKALYFQQRRPFGEHLIAALHIKAGVFAILILAALGNSLFVLVGRTTGGLPSEYLEIIPQIAMFVAAIYVGVSLFVIYRDNVVLGAIRTTVFLSAYVVMVMVGLFMVYLILALSLS
ncbi:MAG: DUF3667 domain-containing protein [Gammaproteobacteria bacterium]|nr:DUF3667 domain-containing protein [Gammaproteobacteria bacterium]